LRLALVDQHAAEVTEWLRSTCRSGEDLERLERILRDIDMLAMAYNARRVNMVSCIKDPTLVDHLLTLKWAVLDAHAGYEFITADPPVLYNCGHAVPSVRQIDLVSVPLDPWKLLLMYPPHWLWDDQEFQGLRASIVRFHNVMLLRNGCRTVFSHQSIVDGPVVRLRYAVEESLRMPVRPRNTQEREREGRASDT
jgi:hypothetical protein